MPVMNGYEATRAIRELNDPVKAQIPITALTANAFDEDREEAINAGMNGYVAKPIAIKKKHGNAGIVFEKVLSQARDSWAG